MKPHPDFVLGLLLEVVLPVEVGLLAEVGLLLQGLGRAVGAAGGVWSSEAEDKVDLKQKNKKKKRKPLPPALLGQGSASR